MCRRVCERGELKTPERVRGEVEGKRLHADLKVGFSLHGKVECACLRCVKGKIVLDTQGRCISLRVCKALHIDILCAP